MHAPFRTLWLALVTALLVIGCRAGNAPRLLPSVYSAYRSPNLLVAKPRRVLLLPVTSTVYEAGYADHWYQLLATELKSIQQFEVVTASPLEPCVQQCLDQVHRGQFAEGALVAVRDRFRADAVLFVSIADFWPYWPPHMAVGVNLVETTKGETIVSVDGNWDAREQAVQELAQLYAHSLSTTETLSNADIVLQSPEYFGKFVAHEVAAALCRLWQPEKSEKEQEKSAAG